MTDLVDIKKGGDVEMLREYCPLCGTHHAKFSPCPLR